MKDIDELAEEIFKKIKEKKSVHYSDLFDIEGSSQENIQRAWALLTKEYKLIVSIREVFSLSEKGKMYDTVELYLKTRKPKRFTSYQKSYLALYGVFGVAGILFGLYGIFYKPECKNIEADYISLESQYIGVVSKFDSLKVEIQKLKQQDLNDTSRTKKIDSLKN